MSFEVFVQFFRDGQAAGVSRGEVRRLFSVVEHGTERDSWNVEYDDLNSCTIIVTPHGSGDEYIESFAVLRPCADVRLWEALFASLKQPYGMLMFPGDSPPIVATEDAQGHIPAEISEDLGPARLVQSGREIMDVVSES